MMPLNWKKSWKAAPEIRGFWPENEGKNEVTVLEFFLQIGHTYSMVSGAEKDREMMPLTWKKSWKVAPEIRGVWPENEGKNEATVLEFFSVDRPHLFNGFWSREGPENDAFDLEKILESGLRNSGFLAGE